MTTELHPQPVGGARAVRGLVAAAHGGPAVAVTVLAGLLVLAQGMDATRGALVVASVLAGQLSIGWSNDLVDLARDRASGRTDKPVATGDVPVALARGCCVAAVLACVPLSLACGTLAGAVHLVCVAAGWAYNLGLKSTHLSWLPYAVAFGGLPAFVALAAGEAPPWWWPVGGALLGVGAHLLNVLPDLRDDAATGVRGLPHALGERWIAPVAAAVLVAATGVALVGAAPPRLVVWATGGAVLVLAAGVVGLSGRRPFAAAVAIALVDAALLVVAR